MAERHTVDLDQGAFNVLTDHERRLLTLQFERGVCVCDAAVMERLPALTRRRLAARPGNCFGRGLCPSPRFAGWVLRPVRPRIGSSASSCDAGPRR